jgi:hypothetical protein
MAIEVVIAGEDDEDAAELDEELLELLDWWHPAPSRANAARATENDAVLFVIARIISSRIPLNRTRRAPVDVPEF